MIKSVAKLYYASIVPLSWILHLDNYGWMYKFYCKYLAGAVHSLPPLCMPNYTQLKIFRMLMTIKNLEQLYFSIFVRPSPISCLQSRCMKQSHQDGLAPRTILEQSPKKNIKRLCYTMTIRFLISITQTFCMSQSTLIQADSISEGGPSVVFFHASHSLDIHSGVVRPQRSSNGVGVRPDYLHISIQTVTFAQRGPSGTGLPVLS